MESTHGASPNGGADENPATQAGEAKAMSAEAGRLGGIGRYEEAIDLIAEIERRFGTVDDPAVSQTVAQAEYNHILALLVLGRAESAAAISSSLAARFTSASDASAQGYIGELILRASHNLSNHGRPREAADLVELLRNELSASEDPGLRALSGQAHIYRAMALVRDGRFDDAYAAFDGIYGWGEPALVALDAYAQRATERSTAAAHREVAWAALGKVVVLDALERKREAVATAEDLHARYRDDADSFVQRINDAISEFLHGHGHGHDPGSSRTESQ